MPPPRAVPNLYEADLCLAVMISILARLYLTTLSGSQ